MEDKKKVDKLFFDAVSAGDVAALKQLLTYPLSYISKWPDGYILLCLALERRHTAIAELLLNCGAKVNSTSDRTDSPLHYAVRNGDINVIKMLLLKGAKVNFRNKYKEVPLHLLRCQCNLGLHENDIVESFVNKHADVNAANKFGMTLLQTYCETACPNLVQILLKSGADVNFANTKGHGTTLRDNAIHYAVDRGHEEIVTILLQHRAAVNNKNLNGLTPLHIACNSRFLGIAKVLLCSGAGIDIDQASGGGQMFKGWTSLHYAVSNGDTELVELLVRYKANVDVKTTTGWVPLHIACYGGYAEIVRILLESGANVESVGPDRKYDHGIYARCYRPLHYAVENGNANIVEMLLREGADVNSKTQDSVTPLRIAVLKGNHKLVRTLLERGANIDSEDAEEDSILYAAVANGNADIVNDILKYQPKLDNRNNQSVVFLALLAESKSEKSYGHIDSLLDYDFPVIIPTDKDNEEILSFAIAKGYVRVVQELLRCGANVNHPCTVLDDPIGGVLKRLPLENAIENNQCDMVKMLVNYGADGVLEIFQRKLHVAVHYQFPGMVQLLLDYGVQVNDVDGSCCSYTHLHCNGNVTPGDNETRVAIAKHLLRKGANVNETSGADGKTPLHIAAEDRNIALAQVLLEHGADPNIADFAKGEVPLHQPAGKNWPEMCELLLQHGANVMARNENGGTALHLAAHNHCFATVELLFKYNVDVNVVDVNGVTALLLAAEAKDAQMCKLLLSKGAKLLIHNNSGLTCLHMASLTRFSRRFVNEFSDGKIQINKILPNLPISDVDTLELLIRKNANINARINVAYRDELIYSTVFSLAVEYLPYTSSSLVLEYLPDCYTNPLRGMRPSHYSCCFKLNNQTAVIPGGYNRGCTAIHLASGEYGFQDAVAMLIKYGVDVNCRDPLGRTALHVALTEPAKRRSSQSKFNRHIVSHLLRYGSDINATDDNDLTPFETLWKCVHKNSATGDLDNATTLIMITIMKHIVKLKTANMYVSEKNLRLMDSPLISCYYEKLFETQCRQEISNMKSEYVGETNFSFYDFTDCKRNGSS